MSFILSVLLTSVVGFFICYSFRRYLGLTEKIFVSIFIGWGYFTGLVLFFNSSFPAIRLSEKVLLSLAMLSFFAALALFIVIKRYFFKDIFKPGTLFKEKIETMKSFNIKPAGYLLIPSLFVVFIALSVTADTFLYGIRMVDPIFVLDQRGELIFLGKSVLAQAQHPFGYYPLHIPILHAWAYFFGFDNPRIFYLIAFFSMVAILIQYIRNCSKSLYCALIFAAAIAVVNVPYVLGNFAEGIANAYFIIGILYVLKYLFEAQKTGFIFLSSFFLTMYASARGEGIFYFAFILLLVIIVGLWNKMFRLRDAGIYLLPFILFYLLPRAGLKGLMLICAFAPFIAAAPILKKLLQNRYVKYILYVLSALLLYYLFKLDYPGHGPAYKIVLRFFTDMFSNWGGIYKNKELLHYYHANNMTCLAMSIFTFFESAFCDPQRIYIADFLKLFLIICRQIGGSIWVLVILALIVDIRSRKNIMRFLMLVIAPFIGYFIIINFQAIKTYYCDPIKTILYIETLEPPYCRYYIYLLLFAILFICTGEFIKKVFAGIEENKFLAYALNLPILYICLSQLWRILLIY